MALCSKPTQIPGYLCVRMISPRSLYHRAYLPHGDVEVIVGPLLEPRVGLRHRKGQGCEVSTKTRTKKISVGDSRWWWCYDKVVISTKRQRAMTPRGDVEPTTPPIYETPPKASTTTPTRTSRKQQPKLVYTTRYLTSKSKRSQMSL